MACFSLVAAIVCWGLAYFFFVLILLGLTTAARGDVGPEIPQWIPTSAAIIAGVLILWGICLQIRRRYAGLTDRQIIGWHLISEFLLLPVRMTFAVGGNLGAIRWLSPAEQDRAWELLTTIHRARKARISSLTLIEPDPGRLFRLLSALQFADFIELHRGEQDWYYSVRSTKEPELRTLADGEANNDEFFPNGRRSG